MDGQLTCRGGFVGKRARYSLLEGRLSLRLGGPSATSRRDIEKGGSEEGKRFKEQYEQDIRVVYSFLSIYLYPYLQIIILIFLSFLSYYLHLKL